MYYKEIIDTLKDILSRFKGVNYVSYQGDDLNNQQHNNKELQCYIDNITLSEYNLTTNVNKMSIEIYILGFPNDEKTPLEVQDECYNVGVNFLAYIDNNPSFYNLMNVYDWSIMTLDRYTAQANSGIKLSLVLNTVSPINLCEVDGWFNDEPYKEDEDRPIDVKERKTNKELTVKPIHLKKQC